MVSNYEKNYYFLIMKVNISVLFIEYILVKNLDLSILY